MAAYAADDLPTAYVEPVAVGDVLPEMPIFLEPASSKGLAWPAAASREQSAYELGPRDAVDAFDQGGRAEIEGLTLGTGEHAPEGIGHDVVQTAVDLVQRPSVVLRVLHPLEIRDGHAAAAPRDAGAGPASRRPPRF